MDFPDIEAKHAVRVQFYSRTKQSKTKSKAEGRPIFEEVPYIRKVIPGDRFQEIDRPARGMDFQEFPNAYAAFKAGKDQDAAAGTPLLLLGLPQTRIEELAFFKVKTIEQMAGVADVLMQGMGMTARAERQKARDYLEAAKSRAPLMRLEAQVEDKDKRIAQLESMVAQLAAAQGLELPRVVEMSAPVAEAPPPKRRGRPPKAKPAETVEG